MQHGGTGCANLSFHVKQAINTMSNTTTKINIVSILTTVQIINRQTTTNQVSPLLFHFGPIKLWEYTTRQHLFELQETCSEGWRRGLRRWRLLWRFLCLNIFTLFTVSTHSSGPLELMQRKREPQTTNNLRKRSKARWSSTFRSWINRELWITIGHGKWILKVCHVIITTWIVKLRWTHIATWRKWCCTMRFKPSKIHIDWSLTWFTWTNWRELTLV